MATNQVMSYCSVCRRQTMHVSPATSHVLHLLLSLITFGVWIIVGFSWPSRTPRSSVAARAALYEVCSA